MQKVFISYRRDDSAAMAGRLYDSLSARFGQGRVFFDVDTLAGGDQFQAAIEKCLAESGALLAVMGRRWHALLEERAASPEVADLVAHEIRTAHARNIPIIPVLVGRNAKAEFERFLKSESPLVPLMGVRHAVEVDEGKDYRTHVDRLIRDVEKTLGLARIRKLRVVLIAAAVLMAIVLGWGGAQVVFRTRYGSLPDGALSVGLTSIEDRSDPGQAVPPEVVFRRAKQQVFLSGVSGYRTFDQHRVVIDELVANGIELYVLIMDPDAPDVVELSERLKKPVDAEIRQVITIIGNNKRLRSESVHIRLMSRMPPFTAVMTDGDIAKRGSTRANGSTLRVQPLVTHNVQHQGVILEFGTGSTGRISGFDFYADDLRQQWADAASSDEKVTRMLAP